MGQSEATEQPMRARVMNFAFSRLAVSPSAAWPSRWLQQRPLLRAPQPWSRPSMMPGGLQRASALLGRPHRHCTTIIGRAGPSPRPARGRWWHAGFGYVLQKDLDRALADFDAAIRNNPKLAAAYYYRGAIRVERDPERALADIDKAISLNPNDADYLRQRISMYVKREDYLRAIADLTTRSASQRSRRGVSPARFRV